MVGRIFFLQTILLGVITSYLATGSARAVCLQEEQNSVAAQRTADQRVTAQGLSVQGAKVIQKALQLALAREVKATADLKRASRIKQLCFKYLEVTLHPQFSEEQRLGAQMKIIAQLHRLIAPLKQQANMDRFQAVVKTTDQKRIPVEPTEKKERSAIKEDGDEQNETESGNMGFITQEIQEADSKQDGLGYAEELLEIITSTINFSTWKENGGNGVIHYYHPVKSLIVYTGEAELEQIQLLLNRLRQAKQRHISSAKQLTKQKKQIEKIVVFQTKSEDAKKKKVVAVIPILDLLMAPPQQAASSRFDKPNRPVSSSKNKSSTVSTSSATGLLKFQDDDRQQPRWRVRDKSTGQNQELSNADELLEVIASTISPNSWEDNGGNAAINYFSPSKSLVISGTEEVHKQVFQFLNAVRKAKYYSQQLYQMNQHQKKSKRSSQKWK